MPDLYRVTFAFAGKSQGWSESYTFPADGTNPGTFNATTVLPIAQARAALLAREYKMDAYRVAKIRLNDGSPVKRAALLFTPDLGPGGTTSGWAGCQPRECVIIQAIDATGQRKKQVFARGIPDQIIEDGGELNFGETIGWFSKLASFTSRLIAAQAGWLEDIPSGNASNVTGYVLNPNGTVKVAFEDNIFAAIAAGSQRLVRLSGINGSSRLNGANQMIVNDATHATTAKALAVFAYSFGGKGVLYIYPKPFISAVAWNAELARTHDTGRPIIASRGRQRAQAKG